MNAYKRYSALKQMIKKFVPHSIYEVLIGPFRLLETALAMTINGLPHRKLKFIGVTGTNGKTTTVAFLDHILTAEGLRVGVNSSIEHKVAGKYRPNIYNMTTSNPFVLFRLLKEMSVAGADWVIMEVASHALDQNRVWGITFDVAIMTNLTQDHLDYHQSMEQYAAAKSKLFRHYPKVMVLNAEDKWYGYFNQFDAPQKLSYGMSKNADARVMRAKLSPSGTTLKLRFDEYEMSTRIHLPGQHNVYNALAAATAAYGMDISRESIQKGLLSLEGVEGRLQQIDEGQDYHVFVDYAHTPDALEQALKTLKMINEQGSLITMTGATGDRDRDKRPLMGSVAAKLSDVVVITDDEPHYEDPAEIRKSLVEGAKKMSNASVFDIADRQSAIEKALELAQAGDTVVFCGMGHRKVRVVGDELLPWDEVSVVRLAVRDKLHASPQS